MRALRLLALIPLAAACMEHLSQGELCERIAAAGDSGGERELIFCPERAGETLECDDDGFARSVSVGAREEVLGQCVKLEGDEIGWGKRDCLGDTGKAYPTVPRGGCDIQVWP